MQTEDGRTRLYYELAEWWHLLSDPAGYAKEAALFVKLLSETCDPAPRTVLDAAAGAASYCRDRDVDIADVAMQFALRHPTAATTLVGMSKSRHVESNLRTLTVDIDPKIAQEVLRILQPVHNVYWKSGRTENDDPDAARSSRKKESEQ